MLCRGLFGRGGQLSSCSVSMRAEEEGADVSGGRVGVGGAGSDQTREAPAQALDLQLVLLELDLGGVALLENRAREDETADP